MRGPKGRGGMIALRDTNADGRADITRHVGEGSNSGIALQEPWLYVSSVTSVLRYRLAPRSLSPIGPPDTVVTGFPDTGGHSSRSLALDDSEIIRHSARYKRMLVPGTPGFLTVSTCEELEVRAGIWRSIPGGAVTRSRRFATLRDGIRKGWDSRDPASRSLRTQPAATVFPEFPQTVRREGA